jgi:BASS family bile acid:Na+ symporter
MMRLLAFLGGHGPKVLFLGVFLGLALPDLAALARPLVGPAVACLTLLALLRVDWGQMAAYLRRPGLTALLMIWLLVVSPVAMWAAMAVLPAPEPLEIALVLMAAAPPILGVTAIAILLGMDGALALLMGLAAILLTPLTVPPMSLWLLGLELEVSVPVFMLRLALLVLGAFAAALALRRIFGVAWFRARAQALDGTVVLTMLVFAVAIMDGVTATLFERPGVVALWILAAFVANPVLQAVSAAAFWWLGPRRALTVGLMSGNCNMGLMLAALPEDTDFDVVLFFAVAQLPMYMLPFLVTPLYRRLLSAMSDGASDTRAGSGRQ